MSKLSWPEIIKNLDAQQNAASEAITPEIKEQIIEHFQKRCDLSNIVDRVNELNELIKINNNISFDKDDITRLQAAITEQAKRIITAQQASIDSVEVTVERLATLAENLDAIAGALKDSQNVVTTVERMKIEINIRTAMQNDNKDAVEKAFNVWKQEFKNASVEDLLVNVIKYAPINKKDIVARNFHVVIAKHIATIGGVKDQQKQNYTEILRSCIRGIIDNKENIDVTVKKINALADSADPAKSNEIKFIALRKAIIDNKADLVYELMQDTPVDTLNQICASQTPGEKEYILFKLVKAEMAIRAIQSDALSNECISQRMKPSQMIKQQLIKQLLLENVEKPAENSDADIALNAKVAKIQSKLGINDETYKNGKFDLVSKKGPQASAGMGIIKAFKVLYNWYKAIRDRSSDNNQKENKTIFAEISSKDFGLVESRENKFQLQLEVAQSKDTKVEQVLENICNLAAIVKPANLVQTPKSLAELPGMPEIAHGLSGVTANNSPPTLPTPDPQTTMTLEQVKQSKDVLAAIAGVNRRNSASEVGQASSKKDASRRASVQGHL